MGVHRGAQCCRGLLALYLCRFSSASSDKSLFREPSLSRSLISLERERRGLSCLWLLDWLGYSMMGLLLPPAEFASSSSSVISVISTLKHRAMRSGSAFRTQNARNKPTAARIRFTLTYYRSSLSNANWIRVSLVPSKQGPNIHVSGGRSGYERGTMNISRPTFRSLLRNSLMVGVQGERKLSLEFTVKTASVRHVAAARTI